MSQGATGGSPRRPGLSLSPRRPPLPTAARAADAVTLTERGAAALALWARIRRRPPDLDGDLVLQVLDVYRYTVDGNWEAATDLTAKGQYAYDLVLSDGIDKAKVVLDPALNNLVATGAVSKLDFICLRDLRRAYDSSKPSVPGVNVLLDFEVLSPRSAAVQLGDRKPSYPRGTELPIRIRAPAIGGRGAYLPAHGIHPLSWRKRSDIPTRTSLTLDIDAGHPGIPDDHPTIAEMLALYIGKRPRGFGTVGPGDREEEPAILGRVVKKMAWMWYGKPSDGGERFPCLFSFTIADCSAGGVTELQVNVWNQLSIDLFHPVQINDIVWLEGYKARNVKDGAGVEVMLNTRNPKGVLRIVRPAAHLSSWPPAYLTARLPPPLLRLPGSHLLQRFPDNTELEHAGLLVHVGLVEREIAGGEEAEYRWCVVRDLHSAGGGGRDVAVKVYTSAGLGAVRGRMAPGFHLLATHLRLLSSATPAKKPGRLGGRALYLVATRATQAWCFDPLDPGGWWFLDGEPGEMVRKMCVPREMWGQDWTVGGNADPARPLADYGALARMRPKLPDAVPFPRLEEVAGALVLGERKRIWVVCRVNAVWLPLSGGGSRRLLIRNTDEAEGVEGTPDADARPEAAESERDAEDQNAAPEPEPEPEPEAASGAQKRPLEDAATPASKRPKPKETPASIFGTIGSFFGFGRNRNGDVVEGGIVEGVEEVENGEGAEGAKEAPAVEGGEGAEKEQEVLPEEGSADGRAPQPEDDLEVVIEISEPGTPMLERGILRVSTVPRIFPPPHPDPKILGAHLEASAILRSFPVLVEPPELPSDTGDLHDAESREKETEAECSDAAADPDRPDPVEELLGDSAADSDLLPACLELDPVDSFPLRLRALVLPDCLRPVEGKKVDAAKAMDDPAGWVRSAFAGAMAPCLVPRMSEALLASRDGELGSMLADSWNGRAFLVAVNLRRDGPGAGGVRCVLSEGYMVPEGEQEGVMVREGGVAFVIKDGVEERIELDEEGAEEEE